jgi:predicted DNA-binding transcriptional regulator AlpA
MLLKIEKEVINLIELSAYIGLSKSTIWKKTSN